MAEFKVLVFLVVFCQLAFGHQFIERENTCSRDQLAIQFVSEQDGVQNICDAKNTFIDLTFFQNHKDGPAVKYLEAETGKKYTLLMVDPDAPGSNTWLHWLISDVDGEILKRGLFEAFDSDQFLAKEYSPPTPPPGHVHQYIFYLCLQPAQEQMSDKINLPIERSHFDADGFIGDHHMHVVATSSFYTQRQH